MTREQKPESAEFRTREEHVEALAFHLHEATCDVCWSVARAMADKFTVEAEARGAANALAEQRRKDAEGEIHVVFSGPPDHDMPHLIEVENASGHSMPAGEWRKREDGLWSLVFPGSADVAALEARVVELEGERVKAISRLRSQIVGYRKTQHSRIAKSLARTLRVVYGEIYRDSDFEHVAVVEDMLRERAEAAERRIAEAVAAEREKIAVRMAEVAKHLARPWGSHLTEEGIAVKEACAARVEQEAAAIREGGEHG